MPPTPRYEARDTGPDSYPYPEEHWDVYDNAARRWVVTITGEQYRTEAQAVAAARRLNNAYERAIAP